MGIFDATEKPSIFNTTQAFNRQPAYAGQSFDSVNPSGDYSTLANYSGVEGVPGGDKSPGGYKGVTAGINAISGLADAYLGFKNLKLGEKQFAFTKDSFNKNLANQASILNTQLESQQQSRLAGSGRYDRTTETGRAQLAQDLESYLAPRKVSGEAI